MKVLALVLSALVVASLYEGVHGQAAGTCMGGTWAQNEYSVNEGGSLVITAQLPAGSRQDTVFLRWNIVEGSAEGNSTRVFTCNIIVGTPQLN